MAAMDVFHLGFSVRKLFSVGAHSSRPKPDLGAREKLSGNAQIELTPLRTGSGNAGALDIIRAVGAQAWRLKKETTSSTPQA
jgi:hypothetical protein